MKPSGARALSPAVDSIPTSEGETPSLLDQVDLAATRSREPEPVVRSARLVSVGPLDVTIAWRGAREPVRALVSDDVERELLVEALEARSPVLVERAGDETPIVIGLVQVKRAREVRVEAERIELAASREILLRTGKAGIRLRDDGEIELVGSRVSAISRGLFRIVGRMLRLN